MDIQWLNDHDLTIEDVDYAYAYNVAVDNANYATELEKRLANADAHIDNAEMAYRDERRKVSNLESRIVDGAAANERQADTIVGLRSDIQTLTATVISLTSERNDYKARYESIISGTAVPTDLNSPEKTYDKPIISRLTEQLTTARKLAEHYHGINCSVDHEIDWGRSSGDSVYYKDSVTGQSSDRVVDSHEN